RRQPASRCAGHPGFQETPARESFHRMVFFTRGSREMASTIFAIQNEMALLGTATGAPASGLARSHNPRHKCRIGDRRSSHRGKSLLAVSRCALLTLLTCCTLFRLNSLQSPKN